MQTDAGFHLDRARRYVAGMCRHPTARRCELRALGAILDSLALPELRLILDLGAGQGYLSENLLTSYLAEGGSVCAVDAAEEMLCQIRPCARVRTALCKLDALPLESGSVDLAVSLAVFHHVTNKKQVLREASRVLRPGTPLVIADVADRTSTQAFFDSVVKEHCDTGHDFDFLDPEWIQLLATAAGLRLVSCDIRDTPWEFPSGAHLCSFLSHIFSLSLPEDMLLERVNRCLPVYSNGAAACLPWQLAFYVLEKPV